MKNVRFNSAIGNDIPNLVLRSQSNTNHRKTNSDIVQSANIQNLSIIHNTNKQKQRRPNIAKTIRMIDLTTKYNNVLQLRQSIMKEYNSLLQLYETNQQKLGRIILNELTSNNNYLYSKEILTFIKCPDLQPLRGLNFELLKHDLIKICEFITNFSAKKRMRQVEIIKQSMISRERMIRESSNSEQYEQIFQNMRAPLKSSAFTIYDQFKTIKVDFNLPQAQVNMNQKLYNKMCDAEECINSIMKDQAKTRERQTKKMLGLGIRKQQSVGSRHR